MTRSHKILIWIINFNFYMKLTLIEAFKKLAKFSISTGITVKCLSQILWCPIRKLIALLWPIKNYKEGWPAYAMQNLAAGNTQLRVSNLKFIFKKNFSRLIKKLRPYCSLWAPWLDERWLSIWMGKWIFTQTSG